MTLQSNIPGMSVEELKSLAINLVKEHPEFLSELSAHDPLITGDLRDSMPSEFRDSITTTTRELTHMGHTLLYSTKDGSSSKVLTSMVRDYLRQSHSDGEPVWSREPTKSQRGGDLVCPLHEDSPERAHFSAIGWPYFCTKTGLPNEMRRQQHIESRHKETWKLMQRERADERMKVEDEDRAAFRKAIELLGASQTPQPTRTEARPTQSPEEYRVYPGNEAGNAQ